MERAQCCGLKTPRNVKIHQPETNTTMQPTSTTVTRKIGLNRGKARLWIEGACLENAGWTSGTVFQRVDSDGGITLRREIAPGAAASCIRKVAGTTGRPIIDTNSATLLTTLGVEIGETVSIEINQFAITITKA